MKEAVGMRKRMILVLLAGLMVMGGCSAYHDKDAQSSSGLEIERLETLPTEAEGPTLSEREKIGRDSSGAGTGRRAVGPKVIRRL